MGRFSVTSAWFLAAVVLIAAVAWTGARLARRHDRRRLAVVSGVVAVALSLGSVADAVNMHFGYLPRVGDLTGSGAWPTAPLRVIDSAPVSTSRRFALPRYRDGAVIELPAPNAGTGITDRDLLVWLPPQYFTRPTARFPVIYLLHGSPGVPQDWLRGAKVADDARTEAEHGHPAIVVMPRMSRGWLDDSECVDGRSTRAETYLIDDVIPTVDQRLRTKADRADRIVGGNSAGGYCALNLGLRHRDVFGTIIDMSGLDQPTHSSGMVALFGPGPNLAALVAANTPAVYIPRLSAAPRTRIWLDVGSHDRGVRPEMERIRGELVARGFPVMWRVRSGSHTFHVWRPALAQSLAWALGGA